jgi:hypothetical protein
MKEYILLMHGDTTQAVDASRWNSYFAALTAKGIFDGGSSIGTGEAMRRDSASAATTDHLAGYIRVRALDLQAAKDLVAGNPVYEAGGTVEVRELLRD